MGAKKRKTEQYCGFLSRLNKRIPHLSECERVDLAVLHTKNYRRSSSRNLTETAHMYLQAKNMLMNSLSERGRGVVIDRIYDDDEKRKLHKLGFGRYETDT